MKILALLAKGTFSYSYKNKGAYGAFIFNLPIMEAFRAVVFEWFVHHPTSSAFDQSK